MPDKKFYELSGDAPGLVWLAQYSHDEPKAYCKKHRLKLVRDRSYIGYLICPENLERFNLRFQFEDQDADLAHQKIFGENLKNLELVRIEPEGYEVVARELNKKNPDYWVDSKLSNTSKGLQLMVQVGKRDGSGKKVQLFVEPAAKRIDFDRSGSDIHPTGIFAEVIAKFKDAESTISQK